MHIQLYTVETINIIFQNSVDIFRSHQASLLFRHGQIAGPAAANYPFALPIDTASIWKIKGRINTQFQFSIYPGLRKAGIRFDAEKNANRAEVEILLDGKVVCSRKFALLKAENHFYFDLPELKDGKYAIRLSTFAGQKKLRTASRDFVRREFPWEKNCLGITEKVYAPFKPLTYVGNSLKTVLNEYTFDNTGLYAEIKPRGESILKGKTALCFQANGKEGRITRAGGNIHFHSGSMQQSMLL